MLWFLIDYSCSSGARQICTSSYLEHWAFARKMHPHLIIWIGNLFDIPLVDTAKAFAEWKSLYSDIVYLEALHQRIMVLNSFEHANELLSKKSYSDRLVPIMLGELMGVDPRQIFCG
ncbi:hypothetical protein EV702DRAFT_92849 [Suillus placidus]|uniref:Uncharacterized protein n=1 Tax=Suillus placidus TaxID=48579 RepID=A0A9P6ZGB5_9AGAM|nr:hypothetical protein EV702DRAFT_92849 [Suillus placidus]